VTRCGLRPPSRGPGLRLQCGASIEFGSRPGRHEWSSTPLTNSLPYNGLMEERLQKILAHAGVASRRAAEKLIEEGRIRLNGKVVREMGIRADARRDRIDVDGKPIKPPSRPTYILLNKPRNVMSTLDDPEGRPTVAELVQKAPGARLYPVGRLDFVSEGLLILTNDGEFTRFMTKAGGVPKVYRVKVTGTPTSEAIDRLRRGIRLDGVRLASCQIEPVKSGSNTWFQVTLKQGRNRQVRGMFEAIGHRVMTLRRTRIGFLEGGALHRGAWRELTRKEVELFYTRYGKKKESPAATGRRKTRPAKVGRAETRGPAVRTRSGRVG
jgi:23S rRNA pseudouridine2605 synthase